MINKYLRKDLLDFKNYQVNNFDYKIKLDANENPFAHKKELLEKAYEWLLEKDNLTRYPDTNQNSLREAISKLYNVSKENVVCGVGSDQIIEYIIKAFIEPGDVILVPNPSFSMYQLTNTLNHGKTISYELEDDFSYNIQSIIDLYKEHNPKIVFICAPNNPTGTTISRNELRELLEIIKCPVVIDEAYAEFTNESMASDIFRFKQLIILRTFSKALGLAGLRVGYGIGSNAIIEAINICKAPYNLSGFSVMMAELVLENLDYYLELVNELQKNKEILSEELKKIPVITDVYPSCGNFILVKTRDNGVADYLEHFRVLVRGYGDKGRLANCMRITVGTKEENETLIKWLSEFYKWCY